MATGTFTLHWVVQKAVHRLRASSIPITAVSAASAMGGHYRRSGHGLGLAVDAFLAAMEAKDNAAAGLMVLMERLPGSPCSARYNVPGM